MKSGKLSMKHSIIVWVTGAVVGWAVMVASVYNLLRFDSQHPASDSATQMPGTVAVRQADDLNKIAPASGGPATPAQNAANEATNQAPAPESGGATR